MSMSVFPSDKPDQNLYEKSSGIYMLSCIHQTEMNLSQEHSWLRFTPMYPTHCCQGNLPKARK